MTRLITSYERGARLPWRLVIEDGDGYENAPECYATFTELLTGLGEVWARVMPEPTDASTATVTAG